MNGRTAIIVAAGVAAPVLYLGVARGGPRVSAPTIDGEVSASSALKVRASAPPIPGKVVSKPPGIMYMGNDDAEHVAFVRGELAALADAQKDPGRRRGILAFSALQGREGSTASLNTYDNQIVTWGTGWGWLGLLPNVFERLKGSKAAARLAGGGLRYLGNRQYEVLDAKGQPVRGTSAPAKVVRATPELLAMLVDVARHPSTRGDVLKAQLDTFLAFGGKVAGQEQAHSQALFNFAAHLQHWAPGFGNGALAAAASQIPGVPSPERDVAIAARMLETFYDRARNAGQWIPDWRQAQGYWRDMVKDGLTAAANHAVLAQNAAPGMGNVGAWGPDARGESVFELVSALSEGHGRMIKAMGAAAPDKKALGQLITWALHKFGPAGLRQDVDDAVNWLAFLSPPWFGLDMKAWAEWQQGVANFSSKYADSSIGQYSEATFREADGLREQFNGWAAKLRGNSIKVDDLKAVELAPLAPSAKDVAKSVDDARKKVEEKLGETARKAAVPLGVAGALVLVTMIVRRGR